MSEIPTSASSRGVKSPEEKSNGFACDQCDYTCSLSSDYVKHQKNHEKEVASPTDAATASNIPSEKVAQMMQIVNAEPKYAKNKTKGKLTAADYMSMNNTDRGPGRLKNDSETGRLDHSSPKFFCEECQYSSLTKTALRGHIRNHHTTKKFVCNLCSYSAPQRGHLVKHMRMHTGEKPFKCSLCEFRAATKFDVTRHMRTHSGEKPFRCEKCTYRCNDKSNLVEHMRTHTGAKPYTCPFCDHRCSKSSNMTNHIRIHTNEKPYECPYCDHKNARKNGLDSHILRKHKDKPQPTKRKSAPRMTNLKLNDVTAQAAKEQAEAEAKAARFAKKRKRSTSKANSSDSVQEVKRAPKLEHLPFGGPGKSSKPVSQAVLSSVPQQFGFTNPLQSSARAKPTSHRPAPSTARFLASLQLPTTNVK